MLIDTPSQTWRPLLRDTALHIALLTQGAQAASLDAWRARCAALVDQVTRAVRDDGADAAWVDEVSLSLCVLLDRVTLRQLPAEQHPGWSRESLQARFHSTGSGTRRVCASIDAMLDDGVAAPDRIEWYCALLELGLLDGLPERDVYVWRLIDASSMELDADEMAAEDVLVRGRDEHAGPMSAISPLPAPGSTSRVRAIGVSVVLAAACVSLAWVLADLYLERLVGERLRDGAAVTQPVGASWRS